MPNIRRLVIVGSCLAGLLAGAGMPAVGWAEGHCNGDCPTPPDGCAVAVPPRYSSTVPDPYVAEAFTCGRIVTAVAKGTSATTAFGRIVVGVDPEPYKAP